MKSEWSIKILMLGILACMSSISFAGGKTDSLLILRVFEYRNNFPSGVTDSTRNIYLKYYVDVQRRNASLALVPTLYNISRGRREFVGESYGTIQFTDIKHYDIQKELQLSTIPHSSQVMPTVVSYMIPDIYGIDLIDGNLLSPFNRDNRRYYSYHTTNISERYSLISFLPRALSTQLVKGFALVENNTGRIVTTKITGEYDMMEFSIDVEMGDMDKNSTIIPKRTTARTLFKFLGNRISCDYTALFNCEGTIPDTIPDKRRVMNSLRPIHLTATERGLYDQHFGNTDSITVTERNSNTWEVIGNHIFNSHGTGTDKASVRLSPLLNPLYFSYSGRRGLSYHIRMGSTLKFNDNNYITFSPRIGYNFKISQFFFQTPLRYTFDNRHHGWIESNVANGNRITSLDLPDYFNDFNTRLAINYLIGKVEVTPSLMYHHRSSVNPEGLRLEGKNTTYSSFAPSLRIAYTPSTKMPTFSVNYERSVKGIIKSNMEYEKWEFDISYKRKMHSLKTLNLRTGYGFYTNRKTMYFIDYTNLHENYLPDGWDDEWTGEFQLVRSEWYNTSKYYYRANASYESPLMFLAFTPFIGKYLEAERLYASFLLLDNTRPYTELGYGFKSRYFSIGLFGSFLSASFQDIGCKFTIELFRKW